jgi:hypothetical protein
MRPPLSGVGSIWIQIIYMSMNGHRGGYELCVTSAHAVAHQLSQTRGGKDAQEDEGEEDADGNHVGP